CPAGAGLRLYRVEPAPPQADRPARWPAATPALLQGDHAPLAWLARHAGETQPLDNCRARDRALAHSLNDRSEGSALLPCPLPFPARDALQELRVYCILHYKRSAPQARSWCYGSTSDSCGGSPCWRCRFGTKRGNISSRPLPFIRNV